MGRKDRNKINDKNNEKEKAHLLEQEELELQQERTEETEIIYNREQYKNFELICDIRTSMLEYCDKKSIPLCDYLTHDAMNDFILYLTE